MVRAKSEFDFGVFHIPNAERFTRKGGAERNGKEKAGAWTYSCRSNSGREKRTKSGFETTGCAMEGPSGLSAAQIVT